MLDKLDRLCFRGIIRDLFDSYLSDRRMYVEVNGCKSETKTLNIGLPQSSVSAPWLFNVNVDTVHILKSVKNNWLNQRFSSREIMRFPSFELHDKIHYVKLGDLKKIYECVKASFIKHAPSLSEKVLFPTSFERQNVDYAVRLFDEKKHFCAQFECWCI